MLTLFSRAVMCNWMVSTGVVAAMMSTSVSGKVIAMWMPILVFFYMGFQHLIVNMYSFPSGLMLGGHFTFMDWTTEVGEVYLLATDGAYEHLDAAAVHQALAASPADLDAAAALASARSHIHLALDQASGQQMVIKTPSVGLRDDPAYLDRFFRPAALWPASDPGAWPQRSAQAELSAAAKRAT